MKILGLLRHAKSEWGDSDKRDFDRGVNARGCRGARLMGDHMRRRGMKWDRVLASPAQRVRITLEEARPGPEAEWDRRFYLASSETILDMLREVEGDPAAVLIAGHNPGLGDMVLELVPPGRENALFDEAKIKFPTASLAVFELDIDEWSDIAPGCGTLIHFARPRDLDPDLGPESGD